MPLRKQAEQVIKIFRDQLPLHILIASCPVFFDSL